MLKRLTTHLLIIVLVQFVIVSSAVTDDVNQKTTGNQSSVIYAPGGTGTVNYDVSDQALEKMNSEIRRSYAEMRQSFSECMNAITKMQDQKIEEFNRTLAEYISRENNVSMATSQAWAKDILQGSSAYKEFVEENKKRKELSDKYNEQLSKNIVTNSYKLFAYVLENIDSSMNEILSESSNVKYEKSPILDLFKKSDEDDTRFVVRSVLFQKGKIEFTINPGKFDENGLVSSCPLMIFNVVNVENAIKPLLVNPILSGGGAGIQIVGGSLGYKESLISFPYQNVGYKPYELETLNQGFKENFSKNFNLFMKFAWGVCNQE